jgi:hypothetical protein
MVRVAAEAEGTPLPAALVAVSSTRIVEPRSLDVTTLLVGRPSATEAPGGRRGKFRSAMVDFDCLRSGNGEVEHSAASSVVCPPVFRE